VLDPVLIPISVNVVIGDNVYELHFKVELEEMNDNLSPLDMEEERDDVDKMDEGDGRISDQSDLMLTIRPWRKNMLVKMTCCLLERMMCW
jgi:hypothetical protein